MRALFTRQVGALIAGVRFVLQASGKRDHWNLMSECDIQGIGSIVTHRTWDLVSDRLDSNPSPITSTFYELGQVA